MNFQKDRFIPIRKPHENAVHLASFGGGLSKSIGIGNTTFVDMLFDENPASLYNMLYDRTPHVYMQTGSMQRSHVLDAPGVNDYRSVGQPVSIFDQRIAFAMGDAVHLWSEDQSPLCIFTLREDRVVKSLQWMDTNRLTLGLSTGRLSVLEVDPTGQTYHSPRDCSTHAIVAIDSATQGSRRQIVGDSEGRLYWHALNQQRPASIGQFVHKRLSFLHCCQDTFQVVLQHADNGIHCTSLWDTRKCTQEVADLGQVTPGAISWCSRQTIALAEKDSVRFFDTKRMKACDETIRLPGVACTVTRIPVPNCKGGGLVISYQDVKNTLLSVVSIPSLGIIAGKSLTLYTGLYNMTHAQYSSTSQTMVITSDAEELHVIKHP